MIVFYTKYNVIESFDTGKLLDFCFRCVDGMRNVPDSFKSQTWSGEESREWKDGNNTLTFEIDVENSLVAFRVAIVDENGELWTTDIALNNNNHEIQLRLAREKNTISADYNRSFNLPYMFKKLVRDGISAKDNNLPVTDKPVWIDENNVSIVADIILGKSHYILPVIFVTHPFSADSFEVDVEELAKDMAGSAHVIVEKTSEISSVLKDITYGKNAYNGAVDVFYEDDSFRYLRRNELTLNQFRYKISHAVYLRSSMRNIDDESSLSSIRIRNKIKKLQHTNGEYRKIALEYEDLLEKKKEDNELFEMASEEIKQLQKTVNEHENKISALEEALRRKNNNGDNKSVVFDTCTEEFYEDEIRRIIIECIKRTLSSFADEEKKWREYHILKDIIDNNTVSEIGDNIKKDMMSILKSGKLSKTDIRALKGLGFVEEQGNHDKYLFHGDDRYMVTVAKTPGDHRDGENVAHDAVKLIFGRS